MPADLSDHLAVAGTRVPSLTNLQALRSASQAMNSSIALIADALGNATLSQNVGFIAKRCTYNGRCLVPMYDCEAWLARFWFDHAAFAQHTTACLQRYFGLCSIGM